MMPASACRAAAGLAASAGAVPTVASYELGLVAGNAEDAGRVVRAGRDGGRGSAWRSAPSCAWCGGAGTACRWPGRADV